MKKLLLFLFISLGLISLSYAHSGRTDSKGGHWNHSSETYHYHSKSNKKRTSDNDDIFFPDNEFDRDPCKSRKLGETKRECLERTNYWRQLQINTLFKRLHKEQLERDKNNSFIYFDWNSD